MASNALPTPDNTRPHTPGSTDPPNVSPTVVRRLIRQGSRGGGGGGKVLSAVLQFEQVIAAQQVPEKTQRTLSLGKGASLGVSTGRGSSASPVLARSHSSEVSLPGCALNATAGNAALQSVPSKYRHSSSSIGLRAEVTGAQTTANVLDCEVSTLGGKSMKEVLATNPNHLLTAEPSKDQLLVSRGPQASDGTQASDGPQTSDGPQASDGPQNSYGPQASAGPQASHSPQGVDSFQASGGPQTRYKVRLGDENKLGVESFARRRSDTEPLMMDMVGAGGEEGGGGNSSSDDSESSIDVLSSPSKDGNSNRGSKEIGEDDGLDKRSDVDKRLPFWVYHDFIPACHTLLTNCTLGKVDSHQVLCDLKNVSNVIGFFCDENQRSCLLPSSSSSSQQRNSLTLPHVESSSKSLASFPSPGSKDALAQGVSAENVLIKVLRSASYVLMGPLLCLAQREFSTELLKQIVEVLQKISWKVEACLSYSSPDGDYHVHNKIFDATHVTQVKDMMIKVQPPEEGKLAPAVKGSHGRSNSVAVHHRPSGWRRPGEETVRSGTTKSTSLDDSDHTPWLYSTSPVSPAEPHPHKGEEPGHLIEPEHWLGRGEGPGEKPDHSRLAVPIGTEQSKGGGEGPGEEPEDEEASYFRPRVYRRTTVSLSRNEADNLGLKTTKIGEWEGETVQREKFYQVVGRNLNETKRDSESVSEEGAEKAVELSGQRKQLSVSSSFEEVWMEEDFPSPLPEPTTPSNGLATPTIPLSPGETGWFSYVKPPAVAAQQASVPHRPVKKTKSDLSRKVSTSQKEIQRVKSEKMRSMDVTQSLILQHHGDAVPKAGGGEKGKGSSSTLSKLMSKRKSFGHSDKKNKKKDDISGSPDTVDQEGLFFESIENFSKEMRISPPAGEEHLGVTVELATPKQGKSPRKKSVGSDWFEITVNTNMILQFGRSNYTILRQLKAFHRLYDGITKNVPGSIHQLPEMPDKKGGISDKRNASKHVRDGLEALLRCIATNGELRATNAFKEFFTPDDLFGSVSETTSEVNFELLMTFYTPDEHVEACHSLVVISGEHSRPVTPTALQNPKPSTMKRGSLHLMQRDGKDDPSTVIIREEGKDALIVSYEDERYVVVAGTFEKLVEQLACEEKPDSRFVTTFIFGYRHVASGMDLLTHLTRRFRMKLAPNATEEEIAYTEKWKDLIQLRVLDVITFWVRKCWPDFYKNAELLDKAREFIVSLKSLDDINFKHAAEKMEALIADKMLAMHTATPPAPCLATSFVTKPVSTSPRHHTSGTPMDINTLTAVQLARELTLIELDFLKALDMHELAVFTWESNNAVNKPFRRNLDAYIARFNEVSFWVATEVLTVSDPRSRGALIEKFVDVAKHCLELRNYNTTISVTSGLSLSAVRRLKRSWECVSDKSSRNFQKLYQLTSPSNNHINYRRSLASIHKKDNFIPYFGVFMRDLTFFNEGNPKLLSNGLINFSKLRALVLKFEEIKKSQCSKYVFPSEDKVKEYCIRLAYLSESDLYDKSEMLEPREVPFEHPETSDV